MLAPSQLTSSIRHHLHNLLHTMVLLAAMAGLLLLIGWSFAGEYGMVSAIAGGVTLLLFGTGLSSGVVLRLYGARELSRAEAPRLFAMVGDLAKRSGLTEMPRLYFVLSDAAVIFSTGHGPTAAIALSAGMLHLLPPQELFGVLGHEICHIRSNDLWVMSLADSMRRVTHFISLSGQVLLLINLPLLLMTEHPLPWLPLLLMMVAPLGGAFVQLALSRTREYDADLLAAQLTGDPKGLASALIRLETLYRGSPWRWLVAGHGSRQPSFLRTHPDTRERVQRLLAVEEELQSRRQTTARRTLECFKAH